MILKIGYFGKDGISLWRYIEDIEDLIIRPYSMREYLCKLKDQKTSNSKNEEVAPDLYMFNLAEIGGEEIYVTGIDFKNKTTGFNEFWVAVADTVFLMNENGKTIDRY